MIQSRIEGVALEVAWPYLSAVEKTAFKDQARRIADSLSIFQRTPQYVFPDPDPVANKHIQKDEFAILFSGEDTPLGFAHNDLKPSNIIVKEGKIVGIIDWEMSGFFGNRSVEVHRKIRCPGVDSFRRLNLAPEKLDDIKFWNTLFN